MTHFYVPAAEKHLSQKKNLWHFVEG